MILISTSRKLNPRVLHLVTHNESYSSIDSLGDGFVMYPHPWYVMSHPNEIISCSCKKNPVVDITYNICGCGKIISHTVAQRNPLIINQ